MMAVRTESGAIDSAQKVVHTQTVFDRAGLIIHSAEVTSPSNNRHRQLEIGEKDLKYQLCLGNRLFTCSKQDG